MPEELFPLPLWLNELAGSLSGKWHTWNVPDTSMEQRPAAR
jgi:hypothetical protein